MHQIDKYWRAYTLSHETAREVKVEDKRSIEFLKVPEHIKTSLRNKQRRIYFYKKITEQSLDIFYLPPSYWKYTEPKTKINFTFSSTSLHEYQINAVKRMYWKVKTWSRSSFIVSWTWTGKSYMILWAISLFKARTLIVVPNKSISKWLYEKIKPYWDIEIITGKWVIETKADVVVIHYQTFNKYYDQLNGLYDILIIDEWHKSPAERVSQYCLWKWSFILWLSATPQRKEFDTIWFKLIFGALYDTKVTALPVEVAYYKYEHEYSETELVIASEWYSPDSNEIMRNLVINNEDRYKHLLHILNVLEENWYTKIIIFSDRVKHIEKTLSYINLSWFKWVPIYWWVKYDIDKIRELEKYAIVCNIESVGEGFDLPELEVWILFVSSSWENRLTQTAWRVNRAYGNKKFWLYIDFVDYVKLFNWTKAKPLWRYARKRFWETNHSLYPFKTLEWGEKKLIYQ